MAEHEDTSAALRRLEAALNRIAAQVARPRPLSAIQTHPDPDAPDGEPRHDPTHHEIVTKLDDLIGGLRSALGIERPS
jgi:hypothetical protein